MAKSKKTQYSFNNFIVTDCNRIAYDVCSSLKDESEGKVVVLHGPSPCGKSHLLTALQGEFLSLDKNVYFGMLEEILYEYIGALHTKNEAYFRNKLKEYDIILIDNLQFAAGKMTVQSSFGFIFAMLANCGKKVVVALDDSPKCIEMMIDIFNKECPDNYICVEIKSADMRLKRKYLETLISEFKVEVSEEARMCLLNSGNIPFSSYKGFILKLKMYKKRKRRKLTDDEIMQCLESYKWDTNPTGDTDLNDLI